MHTAKIVARILEPCLMGLHAKRAHVLQRSGVGLLIDSALGLLALALEIRSSTRFKHRLKSVAKGTIGLTRTSMTVNVSQAPAILAATPRQTIPTTSNRKPICRKVGTVAGNS